MEHHHDLMIDRAPALSATAFALLGVVEVASYLSRLNLVFLLLKLLLIQKADVVKFVFHSYSPLPNITS